MVNRSKKSALIRKVLLNLAAVYRLDNDDDYKLSLAYKILQFDKTKKQTVIVRIVNRAPDVMLRFY